MKRSIRGSLLVFLAATITAWITAATVNGSLNITGKLTAKILDLRQAVSAKTLPVKATLPSACQEGSVVIKSDVSAPQLYKCKQDNSWGAVSAASSGSSPEDFWKPDSSNFTSMTTFRSEAEVVAPSGYYLLLSGLPFSSGLSANTNYYDICHSDRKSIPGCLALKAYQNNSSMYSANVSVYPSSAPVQFNNQAFGIKIRASTSSLSGAANAIIRINLNSVNRFDFKIGPTSSTIRYSGADRQDVTSLFNKTAWNEFSISKPNQNDSAVVFSINGTPIRSFCNPQGSCDDSHALTSYYRLAIAFGVECSGTCAGQMNIDFVEVTVK